MSQNQMLFTAAVLIVIGWFGLKSFSEVKNENADLKEQIKLQSPIAKPPDEKPATSKNLIKDLNSAVETAFKKFGLKPSDIVPALAAELVKLGVKPADVGTLMAAIKDLKGSSSNELGLVLAELNKIKKSPEEIQQEAKKLYKEWQVADTSSKLASIKEEQRQEKERSLLAKLRSRAYRDYKTDVKYFKDRRHNRSQIGESQFVSGMLDQSDAETIKKMEKDRSDWEVENLKQEANGLNKIKTRLTIHYGFTMSEIKELERLDPGD